jgi:hypothetical protein
MNNSPSLIPDPFILLQLVTNRTTYIKDFIKTKTNIAFIIDNTREDYDLSQRVFVVFNARELLTKQEELFNFLVVEAVNHGMYEAVHQA